MNVQKQPSFISLWRAVEGIATQISPPEIGPRTEAHDFEPRPWDEPVPEPIVTCHAFLFKHSKAADCLLSAIDALPKHARPVWLDIRDGMGAPKATTRAEPEGRRVLGLWIRAFDDWEATYFAWFFNRERPVPTTTDPYLEFVNMGTHSGAGGVGFVRPALALTLDQAGIPHSFGNRVARSEDEPHSAERAAVTTPPFRGPLAEVLAMAWERARDRTQARSVFAALVELARSSDIPTPLREATEDGEEVKWLDDEGEIRVFNIRDMLSRMRTINKPRT